MLMMTLVKLTDVAPYMIIKLEKNDLLMCMVFFMMLGSR